MPENSLENSLLCASPESLGIPSQAIAEFLDEMRALSFPIHSFLLLRHGKVAAEGYCPPFDPGRKHRMYSVSKSFTSVAIGMLVTEGKLSLDDKVADFFPEYIPENPSPYLLEATVRHLLTMATFNETTAYDFQSPDFVRAFFDNPNPKHKPGAVFHYDTAATVTLCGIVEKLSRKPMLSYMRPLLDEIGFSKDAFCVKTPEGRSWTGSGILCTPRDLARFGLLCLRRGAWGGKQLVSRAYMEEATTYQIDTTVSHSGLGPGGYGYQFWMLKDGGFACCGMGSQFAFMMPKYDTVTVVTADTQALNNADDVIREAHYRMLGALREEPLPEDAKARGGLSARLEALTLPLPCGSRTTALASKISGVRYDFEQNLFGFKWMRVDVAQDACTLTYEKRTGVHSLKLYMGAYGDLIFPDAYFGRQIGVADTRYRCVSAGAWERENTLLGRIYAVDDYLGTLKMQLTFVGEDLTVFMTKNAEAFFDDYRGYLAGHAAKG